MKIFLSWSGTSSHQVACAFRDWLPSVLQYVKPYVSSEDIEKGARWSIDIAGELEESSFGILCVTRENVEAPWINFEAGALSKSVEKSRVCPFLFDLKRSELPPDGPLPQFQSVVRERDEILKLLKSVNGSAPEESKLSQDQLEKAFEMWWSRLEDALSKIDTSLAPSGDQVSVPDMGSIAEELLDLVRQQHRLLTNPEAILPRAYLLSVVEETSGRVPGFQAWPIGGVYQPAVGSEVTWGPPPKVARPVPNVLGDLTDLGWSVEDLAENADVSVETVKSVVEGRLSSGSPEWRKVIWTLLDARKKKMGVRAL